MSPERQTHSTANSDSGVGNETGSAEPQVDNPAKVERQRALVEWQAALDQQARALDEFPDYAHARDRWSESVDKLKETEKGVVLAGQQAREQNPEIGELEGWLEMTGEELADKSQEVQRLEQEIAPERDAARSLGRPYIGPLAAQLGQAQEEQKWLEDQVLVTQGRIEETLGKYTPLGNAKWYLGQAQRAERSNKQYLDEAVGVAKKEHPPYIEALARLELAEQKLKLVAAKTEQVINRDDLVRRAA